MITQKFIKESFCLLYSKHKTRLLNLESIINKEMSNTQNVSKPVV